MQLLFRVIQLSLPTIVTLIPALLMSQSVVARNETSGAMQGFPPSRDSQVTLQNYRAQPYSEWSFSNMGAPTNTVVIPRGGEIFDFGVALQPDLGDWRSSDTSPTFQRIFAGNYADGVVVISGDKLLYEWYADHYNRDKQHIWFSMTKSLVSSAFGALVEEGKIDLDASPAEYIPELKGSGFERVTIQNVLDHDTALAFKENYTDPQSDFFRFYAPALNMAYMPGAKDAMPADSEIYGVHDFLAKFVKPDAKLTPGQAFDYNSANADTLGWLLARLSGQNLADYLQQAIWSKIGAEHDAFIIVDRAYMPVATGGMNTTLRDAAKFGMLIRDAGKFRDQVVLSADWVNATLDASPRLIDNMSRNGKYQSDPWQAYHNMWWLLDKDAGEFCAVGIHGQVIYINRRANTVMAWFSSQPTASSAANPNFHAKLKAARALALKMTQ